MNNILVVGEHCLDVTVYGNASRLSPESPSIVFNPEFEEINLGMASNVKSNILSLLDEEYKKNTNVYQISQETPIEKRRFIDKSSNYILLRVDKDDIVKKEEELTENKIIEYLDLIQLKFSDFSAFVVSSYNKGFLSKNIINYLSEIAAGFDIPIFADVKYDLANWSKKITFIKINKKEYENCLKFNPSPELYCKNLIVTRGSEPTLWWSGGIKKDEYPIQKVSISQLSGSGDTYASALVIRYLQTKDIHQSIIYANHAATLKATKRGIVAIKKEELDDFISERNNEIYKLL